MAEPISTDEAKLQLRVDHSADDTLIDGLIAAARQDTEKYTDSVLVVADVTMSAARFEDLDRLRHAPVNEVAEVRYLDTSGVEQILDPATYELVNVEDDPLRPMIRLAYGQQWPSIRQVSDAIRIDANVGYETVPAPVIQAMMLLITQWYDNRQPIAVDVKGTPTELPNVMTALLSNYRR